MASPKRRVSERRKPTRFQPGMRIAPGHGRQYIETLEYFRGKSADGKAEEWMCLSGIAFWFEPDDLQRVIPEEKPAPTVEKKLAAAANATDQKLTEDFCSNAFSGQPMSTLEGTHWRTTEAASEFFLESQARCIIDLRDAVRELQRK